MSEEVSKEVSKEEESAPMPPPMPMVLIPLSASQASAVSKICIELSLPT